MIILFFLLFFLFFLVYYLFRPKDNQYDELKIPNSSPIIKKNDSEAKLVRKISYLGLKQFVEGLEQDKFKEKYKLIAFDHVKEDKIEEKVLNFCLETANTLLIQGTIDFLTSKLNKEIFLCINNDNIQLSSCSFSDCNSNETINLKLCNKNNHFFISKFHDTPGDGYCFFHALIKLLDQKVPDWRDKIKQDLNFDLNLSETHKNDILTKLKKNI
ncbi:MAG: hypothetical protein Q8781_01720 [Candidatus Phytoplasma stylosanthis]|uniref:hypothetical protein n=1 Tax=Candidatus Phytoplasma stylosanthis TaxID=2798314 RepID=UPI00293A4EB5|nr:hypothetical protein [Candidatus Phytoplasma stylosanthis]MDV3171003.1 hypothetical protein [Candidatus Phytoplasma stylosanthis]MDV3174366.1 hypothetical protein [Candidatus Phytoplasma stylosanthis]MDV3202503.1 hypothetical protein [Candidatus Phytoplasma stylosanthis]